MKKHLSLIVMALVASALMFTSCGKEKFTVTVNVNDPTMGTVTGAGDYELNSVVTLTATPNEGYVFVAWNDGNTDNPRQITVTADVEYTATFQQALQPGVYVTFNGANWTAGKVDAAYYADYSAYDVYAMANANEYPIADICSYATTVGSSNDSYTGDAWANDVFNYLEYYNETALTDANGTYYGDWWGKSANISVTEFDATALNMSAEVDATMFNAKVAFVDGAGFDAAPTTAMGVNMVNVDMNASKAPFKAKKFHGQKLFVK